MLKMYAIPESLYCAKTRIVLRHKGLVWQELPPPGGYGSVEYKRTVPSGNLPALDHDGTLIADSEAIAEYLNEVFPVPAMLPSDHAARARCRDRSRFHDTRLEPELRRLFPYLETRDCPPNLLQAQASALSERLAQLSVGLEAGADEDYLTLDACGFPVTFRWIDALCPHFGLQVSWPGPVMSWRAKIERFDAIAEELSNYGPRLETWLASH